MKKLSLLLIILSAGLLMSFQLITTQIKIKVLNNLAKPEEGVRVRIFKTEEDYKAEKNIVQEHYTDKKGQVSFKELDAIPYYINAVKDTKTNFGNGEKTEALKEKMINKMTIIIAE